jgi:hypothetical protein
MGTRYLFRMERSGTSFRLFVMATPTTCTGPYSRRGEKGYVMTDTNETRLRSAAASLMGKAGGLIGGRARAKSLSPERRKEIARNAAQVRWKNPVPTKKIVERALVSIKETNDSSCVCDYCEERVQEYLYFQITIEGQLLCPGCSFAMYQDLKNIFSCYE